MSKSSLESPGVAITVRLQRVPRAVPSNSSKPSGLRVGAACLKLFVVLGIVGKLRVDEVCSRIRVLFVYLFVYYYATGNRQ